MRAFGVCECLKSLGKTELAVARLGAFIHIGRPERGEPLRVAVHEQQLCILLDRTRLQTVRVCIVCTSAAAQSRDTRESVHTLVDTS